MESEIEELRPRSDLFDQRRIMEQVERIKRAALNAQKKIDYESAHDPQVSKSIEVVENFLRKRHRLCYGGQAINAHLPKAYQFYDPEYSIPDYDFFTPSQKSDLLLLVKDLRAAGFVEIYVREGMHEGTFKIYVDYVPVADMTAIDPSLYRILSRREYRMNGISYLDANTLRMMMYLELSRPAGEVSRWGKVYERLVLFNEFAARPPCRIKPMAAHSLSSEQVSFTLSFMVEHQRIFAGADLISFYDHTLRTRTKRSKWVLTTKRPILFYSPTPEEDAESLMRAFHQLEDADRRGKKMRIVSYDSKGVEVLPSMKIIVRGKKPLVFIIRQTACHSYLTFPLDRDRSLPIASMDTLITLYFSLGLIRSAYFDMGSMECVGNHVVQLSIQSRDRSGPFPFISITCQGHQQSVTSLIRKRIQRMTTSKNHIKGLLEGPTRSTHTTRSMSRKKRHAT
jgi:hypothetical protein